MITTNAIQRTFHIKRGDASGTAFAIDRASRQYLVTARHVVDGITSGETTAVFHENQWKNVTVDVVGIGKGDVDVTVLSCPTQLAPTHPLEASFAGLTYGQTVYFLGFPFGWDGGAENMNRDFPIPFVKTGIISALIFGNPTHFFIDGHGNKGFSGGPVVFVPNGQPQTELRVAGIVANYPTPLREPIVDKRGNPIVDDHNEPAAFFSENPGFVVAMAISHATDLTDANPVGFQLPTK